MNRREILNTGWAVTLHLILTAFTLVSIDKSLYEHIPQCLTDQVLFKCFFTLAWVAGANAHTWNMRLYDNRFIFWKKSKTVSVLAFRSHADLHFAPQTIEVTLGTRIWEQLWVPEVVGKVEDVCLIHFFIEAEVQAPRVSSSKMKHQQRACITTFTCIRCGFTRKLKFNGFILREESQLLVMTMSLISYHLNHLFFIINWNLSSANMSLALMNK